ncbi:hypothetical protein HDV00_003296 [Rhizophlyctis rosea]|nr:hypothetical protein HDV00_003296 [Rhizophlyctis rosea]
MSPTVYLRLSYISPVPPPTSMKEVAAQYINPLDAATVANNENLFSSVYLKTKFHHHAPTKVTALADQLQHPHHVSTRSVDALIRDRVVEGDVGFDESEEDAFYVGDMGEVVRQHAQFRKLLPRVEPFYGMLMLLQLHPMILIFTTSDTYRILPSMYPAVKCNPDQQVLKTLSSLGTGFDCASKGEIQMAIDQGTPAAKIIYANPCKQASHIRFAAAAGVTMMTFDNADELRKVKKNHPNPQMILRIRTDDSRSICKLGTKFGASIETVPSLLAVARQVGVDVIGISFHVGSGCFDASAFGEAVILARKAFDIGTSMGFHFHLLDVGGGFPGNGTEGVTFPQIASILGPAIDQHFDASVRVIAEPGRYYVCSAFTLAVNVIARRVVPRDLSDGTGIPSADDHPSYMYYINDGMYGSFNCITFDHAIVHPKVLSRGGRYLYQKEEMDVAAFPCSIWGPTCDSIDCIGKEFALPALEVGDWMVFENMGAYTMCAASNFNGFKKSVVVYTNTEVGL